MKLRENVAYHCPTEELAKEFINIAYRNGYIDSTYNMKKSHWDLHKEKTCYRLTFRNSFDCIFMHDILSYANKGYEIIEFKGENKMEKEDVLKIEFQPVFDKWAWRIVYQNEEVLKRGEFGDDTIMVGSISRPFYDNEILYLRGGLREHDDDVVGLCTVGEKAEIEAKVKAVNEKYGIVKRWRAKDNESYFVIDLNRDRGNVKVDQTADIGIAFDTQHFNSGNYFRTEAQCQKACDEINAIFEKNKQGAF